jgi:hypothetical protein
VLPAVATRLPSRPREFHPASFALATRRMPLGRYQDIRHYGLLASGVKADNLVLARKLLDVAPPAPEPEDIAAEPAMPVEPCPSCGSAMRIIEVFKAGERPRHTPTAMPAAIRIDTS